MEASRNDNDDDVGVNAAPPVTDTADSQLPSLENGSFVELHALSRQDMNGQTGEIVGYNGERFLVKLDSDDKTTIKVKPDNCKRIALQPMEIRKQAMELASAALDQSSISKMKLLCLQSTELDRCCVLAWIGLGQSMMQQGNKQHVATAVTFLQRAVAQSHAAAPFLPSTTTLRIRLELATCLGEAGRIHDEATQLERVLTEAPHFVHGVYALGLNRMEHGRKQEAMELYQRVLSTPDTDSTGLNTPEEIADLKRRAKANVAKDT